MKTPLKIKTIEFWRESEGVFHIRFYTYIKVGYDSKANKVNYKFTL